MSHSVILFDFDYTLADCTDSIVDGFHHAFRTLGHPLPSREAVRLTIGLTLEDAYAQLSGVTDPQEIAKFRPLFIEAAMERQRQETVLFPGGDQLLEAIHAAGHRAGIVSSKRGDTIQFIMNRLGLGHTMSLIIGSEHVQSHKPDPEGICQAMERLGVTPDAVLFCGDTIIDAQAAQRANVDFVAVLNGTTPREAFQAFPHLAICDNLSHLAEYLGLNVQSGE